MDRINKFLLNRPKKNEKIIKYNKKKFKITKEDLKTVRDYKRGKNLTGEKLIDVKIKFDELPVIEDRKRKYNEEFFKQQFLKKNKNKFEERNKKLFKEEIYDIYENESLSNYKQEWVYDISKQYDKPVEELKTTDASEIEAFAKKLRKPVEKTISVEEIVKIKSLNYNFEVAKKYDFSVTDKENNFVKSNCIIDLLYGCEVNLENSDFNLHKFQYSFNKNSLLYKNKEILAFDNEIKAFDVSDKILSIAFKNRLEVYRIEERPRLTNIFKFKGETVEKVKMWKSKIFVGASNGITECSLTEAKAFTSLSVVIDFDVNDAAVVAINNLKRLLVIQNDNSST